MKLHNLMAAVLFLVTGVFAQTTAPVEGQDYTVVTTSVTPLDQNKDKIEIVEFFSFTCSHCRDLDPILRDYSKTLPQDTVLRTEQIFWNEMPDASLTKLKSTVSKLHLENQLNSAIHKALFDEQVQIWDPQVLTQWLNKQSGVDSKTFMDIYNSFTTTADMNRMKELTERHGINATPMVVVGGKYQVKNPKNIQLISALVEKVRKERNMPDPQTLPTPKASSPAVIFK